jgi:uncharacterized protein (TIGR04222 family)
MDGLICFLSVGLAAALCAVARWWLSMPGDEVDARSLGLHEYEIAYLAEGTPRAVGAAVASLASRKLLIVEGDTKTIHAVGEIPGMAHPIERAVHAFAAVTSRTEDIRKAGEDVTSPIRDRLESLGLILSPESSVAIRFLAGAVYAVTLATAWALDGGRGVGGFTFMVGLFAGAVLVLRRPFRTRRGSAVLSQLATDSVALKESAPYSGALMSAHDIGLAVGLFGAPILAGGPLSELAQALERVKGGCGSCGSGGCGGCGDGGCGGCGCA